MYCIRCGLQLPDDAKSCSRCGTPVPGMAPPQSGLPWAILACVCCCPATGIVAIVYALKSTELFKQQKWEEARKAAAKSVRWSWISVHTAIVLTLAYMVYGVILLYRQLDQFDQLMK